MSILALVWNTERYGLEILRNLNVEGNNMKSSQIYPALKKLASMGALNSRDTTDNGVTRTYYNTSEQGKELVKHYVLDFLNVFYRIMFEQMFDHLKIHASEIQIGPGMNVVDVSAGIYDNVIQMFASRTGVTGHYFLKANDKNQAQLLQDRIEYLHLSNNTTVLSVQNAGIGLPSETIDYVLAFFSLHETTSEWILPECARLLKKGGRMAIVEMELYPNVFFEQFIQELIPNHLTIGIDFVPILENISQFGFRVEKDYSTQGIRFLVIQKYEE
ncbi:MAG: methyltransferase domain-containing protein [Promethearchaeota archaeon]|nr:MAG: methyltransferase domain-containing protein [Candidatus Lokiarchaeota archaeon]